MRKLKILELDFTTIQQDFVSYSAGIYQKTLTVPESVQDVSFWVDDFGFTWDGYPTDKVSVGSVRVDDTLLGAVGSLNELREQDGSFYFDYSSQTLYLALYEYYNTWTYRSYKVGETTGFLSEAQLQEINGKRYPVDSQIGALYYEPRLVGDISAELSVDDQKNGIFVYTDLEASLNNGDGKFDNIRDNVTGNEARVLVADIADSKEEEIATGYPYKLKAQQSDFSVVKYGIVEDIDYSDPNEPSIKAIDIKSDWTQKIGTTFLTTDDYPNLEDKYIDKRAPILIGSVRGTSCIQLEPNPGSSSATDFLICDTSIGAINSVSGIYFDGKISGSDYDDYLTGGMYSVNTSTGVLTINNFDRGKAYFYGQVTTMQESAEIALFLLDTYAGLAYIPSNFNIKEIDDIKTLGYQTHVYVDEKGESLNSVIEKLIMDINVDFFQQGSVLSMRLSNQERASREDITPSQIFDNPSGWVNDRTDTVKTINVTYNQDYRTEENDTYYNAEFEQTAIDNNRKAVDKNFDTNLTQVEDVTEIYNAYYSRFVVPSRTVTVNKAFASRAELTDFVTFRLTRKNNIDGDKEIFPRGLYKVIGKDPINNTLEIVYFSDRPEPYYSQGLPAGLTASFGAPDANLLIVFFDGNPSGLYASGLYAAGSAGFTLSGEIVEGSGNVAGQTQIIGE